jgi:hypothetical protein
MWETAAGRGVRIGVPRFTSWHGAGWPPRDRVSPVRFHFLFLFGLDRSSFASIGMAAWRLWMKFTL